MGDISRLLAKQQIREYDLRLQHVDEVLEHAEKELARSAKEAETRALLDKLKGERDRLAGWLEQTKRQPLEDWREYEIRKAGPMAIWDAIAQQVEKLVERIER
jgi:hypothetical protein